MVNFFYFSKNLQYSNLGNFEIWKSNRKRDNAGKRFSSTKIIKIFCSQLIVGTVMGSAVTVYFKKGVFKHSFFFSPWGGDFPSLEKKKFSHNERQSWIFGLPYYPTHFAPLCIFWGGSAPTLLAENFIFTQKCPKIFSGVPPPNPLVVKDFILRTIYIVTHFPSL